LLPLNPIIGFSTPIITLEPSLDANEIRCLNDWSWTLHELPMEASETFFLLWSPLSQILVVKFIIPASSKCPFILMTEYPVELELNIK
jgi:hypothetical protein